MSAALRGVARNGNVIMTALIASFPAPRFVLTSLAATLAISAAVAFTGKSSQQFIFDRTSLTHLGPN